MIAVMEKLFKAWHAWESKINFKKYIWWLVEIFCQVKISLVFCVVIWKFYGLFFLTVDCNKVHFDLKIANKTTTTTKKKKTLKDCWKQKQFSNKFLWIWFFLLYKVHGK